MADLAGSEVGPSDPPQLMSAFHPFRTLACRLLPIHCGHNERCYLLSSFESTLQ
jgi:hypothetical protein